MARNCSLDLQENQVGFGKTSEKCRRVVERKAEWDIRNVTGKVNQIYVIPTHKPKTKSSSSCAGCRLQNRDTGKNHTPWQNDKLK